MCYYCLRVIFERATNMVLEESGSPIASPALLDEYKNLVEALEDSAQWSASTKGMHKDPLTFSYSVVTAQMRAQLRQGGSRLTPQHMRANLIHVVRRMQTVADEKPLQKCHIGYRTNARHSGLIGSQIAPEITRG